MGKLVACRANSESPDVALGRWLESLQKRIRNKLGEWDGRAKRSGFECGANGTRVTLNSAPQCSGRGRRDKSERQGEFTGIVGKERKTPWKKWRKCMGIEPTGRKVNLRPNGFEDRGAIVGTA